MDDVGEHFLTVRVTDGILVDEETFKVTVVPEGQNWPPIIHRPLAEPVSLNIGDYYRQPAYFINVWADDANDSEYSLIYSAEPVPDTIDSNAWWKPSWFTGDGTFRLLYQDLPALVNITDDFTLRFTVTDLWSASDYVEVPFHINAYPEASPAEYSYYVAPGRAIQFTMGATDPNGDPVTWVNYDGINVKGLVRER